MAHAWCCRRLRQGQASRCRGSVMYQRSRAVAVAGRLRPAVGVRGWAWGVGGPRWGQAEALGCCGRARHQVSGAGSRGGGGVKPSGGVGQGRGCGQHEGRSQGGGWGHRWVTGHRWGASEVLGLGRRAGGTDPGVRPLTCVSPSRTRPPAGAQPAGLWAAPGPRL